MKVAFVDIREGAIIAGDDDYGYDTYDLVDSNEVVESCLDNYDNERGIWDDGEW